MKDVAAAMSFIQELTTRETDHVGAEPYLTEIVVKRGMDFAEERQREIFLARQEGLKSRGRGRGFGRGRGRGRAAPPPVKRL